MSDPVTPPADDQQATAPEAESLSGSTSGQTDLPVVGIGCSAGGLEALEKFLTHVPPDSGWAIVVIQHLSPDHVSALPRLLQRLTPMRVAEALDGALIEPNCVYVIPPDKDLSLLHGKLRLLEQMSVNGLRLPIDFFLRSLANDRREKAIGVILSGMGSDGVFGLRAIKEKGGLTLTQEPASAQSDSMPRSAIDAGVADIVALPESLPARITDYLQHPAHDGGNPRSPRPDIVSGLDKIVILLRDRSGNDFSLYKSNTLSRRVERRMAVNQIASIDAYARYLRSNPQELDLLFRELLIGVTSFFRDPEVWDYLRTEAIPYLFAQHPGGKTLRAWVSPCSTGEEAYSLAMVFQEALAQCKPEASFRLQIYATDLDAEAIDRARRGHYPENICADVSAERLARHFVADDAGGFRISKSIRDMVVFAPQNIIADPPFTKLDLLCCRNLLIYFGAQLQERLLPLFYYALNPGGLLLLGSAESVGNFTNLFAPANAKARIFRRQEQTLLVADLDFPRRAPVEGDAPGKKLPPDRQENLGQLADQFIQQNWAPAAVLVNEDGDIVYISGRTGKYLEPAAGKTNINIYAMAREGLREAIAGVVLKALRVGQPIHLNKLRISSEGGTQIVDVIVQAIDKPEALRGRVLIVFKDVPTPSGQRRGRGKAVRNDDCAELMQELQQTREALQVTHEEMQSTVEELKSSNEELQTVNAELQAKVDDLTWVRNDMSNLLNSTEIATVFLNNEMKLRRFTTHATRLFKLIPGDVGRPLSHVVTDLDYPQLKDDANEVLRTLVFQEKSVSTHDGRWFRVRIMPYRTQDNVIDGVVITFTDITEIKQLEAVLRARGD